MSKRAVCIFLLVVLVSGTITCSDVCLTVSGNTEENHVPDKVLVFLRDVVKLDMTKYSVTPFKPALRNRDDLGGLSEIGGKVVLESLTSQQSRMSVIYSLINGTLNSIGLDIQEGLPLFSQPMPANLKEMADGFLERYQTYTGDADISDMRNMVNTIDTTKNATTVAGNIEQEVQVSSKYVSFRWKYTYNGVGYDSIYLLFENGVFNSFGDDTSYRGIGSTEVKITKDDAIQAALKQAEDFAYTYSGEVFSNFSIAKEKIGAELLVMGRENPLLGGSLLDG